MKTKELQKWMLKLELKIQVIERRKVKTDKGSVSKSKNK
jgi:hypothetical protein